MSNVYRSNAQIVLDTISHKDMCISGVLIGSKKGVLLNVFGKPDSIVRHIDEFEGTDFFEYVYDGSSIYFQNDIFTGVDLKDDHFQFDYGQIKVGDSIEKVRKAFPKSFPKEEIAGTIKTIRIKIGRTDTYLLIISSNNQIKRIMTWDDI